MHGSSRKPQVLDSAICYLCSKLVCAKCSSTCNMPTHLNLHHALSSLKTAISHGKGCRLPRVFSGDRICDPNIGILSAFQSKHEKMWQLMCYTCCNFLSGKRHNTYCAGTLTALLNGNTEICILSNTGCN